MGEESVDQRMGYDVMKFASTNVQLEGTTLWQKHVPGKCQVNGAESRAVAPSETLSLPGL